MAYLGNATRQHRLDLMRRLATSPSPPDVMVISAARDLASIRRAMRQGAIGYLAKPFGFALLAERFGAYRNLRRRVAALASSGPDGADQADIDALFALLGGSATPAPPKGQSASTMPDRGYTPSLGRLGGPPVNRSQPGGVRNR